MEYGLWNSHGGFWPVSSNPTAAPPEGIPRNIYNPVSDIEPSTFQATSAVGGDGVGVFTTVSPGSLPCQPNLRSQTDFLSMKNHLTVTGRVSVSMTGHHEDQIQEEVSQNISQAVVQQILPMAPDIITEQSSMESLASTESPLPNLLDSQQSHNSNDGSSMCKKEKMKAVVRGSNDDDWVDANGNGTNMIKTEANPGADYLFQPSYQQPMYGMMFPRAGGNRRETAGTSDETDDDDDDETEDASAVQESRPVDDLGVGQDANFQSRSPPSVPSSQEATPVNFQRNGYECGECGLVAETRPSLKKHISMSHPAPNPDPRLTSALLKKITATAKCPVTSCRFRTSDQDEMEDHVARHVTGGYKIGNKKRNNSIAPQRVRYEREEYRCQICAYSCTVEKAFYKHLKVHSVGRHVNQVKISCVICGKDRSSEVDMNKHMKKHRDDRFFCCDICIFKTVQLKKLIQHRRMHTGEKPHLCPHCSYRSARRDNLRSHVRRVHKKDNLFCDTFSPRGLLLTANASASNLPSEAPATTTTAAAAAATTNPTQPPSQQPQVDSQ